MKCFLVAVISILLTIGIFSVNRDSGNNEDHAGLDQQKLQSGFLEWGGGFSLVYANEQLRQYVGFESGEKGVRFRADEVGPGAVAPSMGRVHEFGTTYRVVTVAHSGQANMLYVLGKGRGGDAIIERWEIRAQEGAYFASRPVSAQPIGIPIVGGQLSTGIVGGVWQAPLGRSGMVIADRKEIYRVSNGSALRLVADPDGRFVFVLVQHQIDGTRGLYKVALDEDRTPTLSVSSNEVPAINDGDGMFLREDLNGTRVVIIEALDRQSPQFIVLADPENDGLFLDAQAMTYEEWTGQGLMEKSSWATNFLSY